jgi:TPM domain
VVSDNKSFVDANNHGHCATRKQPIETMRGLNVKGVTAGCLLMSLAWEELGQRAIPVVEAWSTSSSRAPSSGVVSNSRRDVLRAWTVGSTAAIASATVLTSAVPSAEARLEAVDNPKLLPSEKGLNVIQTEKFLTAGQAKRMNQLLSALERDTGWRVRVLCQSYPNTPGLAIRDYWDLGKEGQKDDKYVVLVVDQFGGRGNVLNFNVGEGVKFALPNVFWTRLQAKYGNTFYVRDNGIDLAVTNAVDAIVSCLRSEEQYCVQVPDAAPSLKSLGM